ncbi:MAG: hypothetical protein K2N84_05280 [Clostridia bacterium]|nr:hypothetical protein [Clostridia bacterium]
MDVIASIAQRSDRLFEIVIVHWEISLIVLLAFTVLFIWIFKGIKGGVKATVAVLVLGAIAIAAGLAVQLVGKGITQIVAFAIAWVPTVLFLVIVLVSTLVGARRGLRKSLILAVQAFVAAGICIALFFFCITGDMVDSALLSLVNTIMGGEHALQNTLGVSAECTTLRECLADFLPKIISIGFGSEITMLLAENGAYLMTLADLVYRLAIAVVLWLVYFLLVFIFYIIYAIAYPERKYRRKREMAFANGKVDCSYKRNRMGGGVVGLVRGLVVGLITMSFIGSAFFMVAGGAGEGDLADRDFGNSETNFYYSIYRSVESYGAQGIFKVLGSVRDLSDSPYYLFAADLVFSGGLDDDLNDVHATVRFRKELGAYTGFAKDTITLLMRYGEDRIEEALDTGDSGKIMDTVVDIMKEPGFRAEFENLVDNFDSQTYIINLSLAMAGTIVAHIDDMSFASSLGASNKELLKILFQRGYLSETIPDERELRVSLGAATTDDPNNIQPYLSVNHLFDKKDAQTVLRIALGFLANEYSDNTPLELVKRILPELEGLSILGTGRKGEVNPVLGRLYCFLENTYLTDEGQDGVTYSEIKAQNISWVDELHSLISVTDDMFALYDSVKREDDDYLQMLLGVFDDENEEYENNLRLYDNICATVADSAILGKVLASGKITAKLREGLEKVSGDIYLPDGIVFENRYDANGTLVSHGETFQIFYGLRLLGDKENKELFDLLFKSENSDIEITELFNVLADAVVRQDGFGLTLADYLTESSVLRSVVSAVFIGQSQDILAVPYSSRERNAQGEAVNFIVKDELKQIFEKLPELVDIITPFLDGSFEVGEVVDLLHNATLREFLDSGNGIMEGTLASILVKQMNGNGLVVIPRALDTAVPENLDGWASDITGRPGEIRNLLTALDQLDGHLEKLLNGELEGDELMDILGDLDEDAIDTLLKSNVLHYTFSKSLREQDETSDGFALIIPASATVALENDVLDSLVKKQELRTILSELNSFGFTSEMGAADILRKLVENKQKLSSSNIISASIVNYIVQNDEMKDALSLPEDLRKAGSRAELERYGEGNVWYFELPALVDGLDEVFGVSAGAEDIDLSQDGLTERMSALVKELDTPSEVDKEQSKLEVVYSSIVIKHNLTERLDESLDGVANETAIQNAKGLDGYYRREEIGALSAAAKLLDIDLLGEEEDIDGKIKDNALTLNDPAEGYAGQTKLDVMYPSVIIRSMLTEQLDDALLSDTEEKQAIISNSVLQNIKEKDPVYKPYYSKGEVAALLDGVKELEIKDVDALQDYEFNDLKSLNGASRLHPDSGETRLDVIFASDVLAGVVTYKIDGGIGGDLIDLNVRNGIKNELGVYPQTEVASLLDAMDELAINTLDDFKTHNFTGEIKTLNQESAISSPRTRLNVLYGSKLAGGIITKKVQDEIAKNADLADHSRAYEETLAIYKESEVRELVNIMGGKDISEYTLGSVDEVRAYVEPVDGAPRSYIVAATLTKNLTKNKALIVPASQMDGESVNATELTALIDAFKALGGDGKLAGWDVASHMVLPDAMHREIMVESAIMRATLTKKIVELNSGITVAQTDVHSEDGYGEDQEGRMIAVFTKQALLKLFEVLDVCGNGNSLGIPKFDTVANILVYREHLDTLCEFSAIRYRISETILKIDDYRTKSTEAACVLTAGNTQATIIRLTNEPDYEMLTYEEIVNFLKQFS